jgi:hypothetical protein
MVSQKIGTIDKWFSLQVSPTHPSPWAYNMERWMAGWRGGYSLRDLSAARCDFCK